MAALSACGCYESGFPLDPGPRAHLDAALLGTWRCMPVDADADERPATVVVKTARQDVYGVTWQEEGSTPQQYEAHASSALPRLLNVRELNASNEKPWSFARYTFLLPQVVQLQMVEEKALANVEKSPAAVRAAIGRLAASPSLFTSSSVCVGAKTASAHD